MKPLALATILICIVGCGKCPDAPKVVVPGTWHAAINWPPGAATEPASPTQLYVVPFVADGVTDDTKALDAAFRGAEMAYRNVDACMKRNGGWCTLHPDGTVTYSKTEPK